VEVLREDGAAPVRRIRTTGSSKASSGGVFTDSLLLHWLKTAWALVTTPRAILRYRAAIRSAIAAADALLTALADLAERGMRRLMAGSIVTWRLTSRASRRAARSGRRMATRAVKQSRAAAGRAVSHSRSAAARAMSHSRSAADRAVDAGRDLRRRAAARSRRVAERAAGTPEVLGKHLGAGLDTTASTLGRAGGRLRRSAGGLQRILAASFGGVWNALLAAGRRSVAAVRFIGSTSGRRITAAATVLAVTLVLTWPVPVELGRSVALSVESRVPSIGQLSVPRVSLPKFSLPEISLPSVSMPEVSAPDVTVPELGLSEFEMPGFVRQAPAVVRRSSARLGDLVLGPPVVEGDQIVVADLEWTAVEDGRGLPLGLALETYLAQSRVFGVVPRERAITALGRPRGEGLELSSESALEATRAAGYAAVVAGRTVTSEEGATTLRLALLDSTGKERRVVDAPLSEENPLEALEEAARDLRRSLGEADTRIGADSPTGRIFTPSYAALEALAESRSHLFADRHARGAQAARAAIRQDSSFALAYMNLGVAYALGGDHRRARAALDAAWQWRERLPERERLRLEADRLVFQRRYVDAILAYEELYQTYRDDVDALKSQYMVRNLVDAGSADGNLYIAYRRDSVDWPSLDRVARYLGYARPLPDVDSLVALLHPVD
jgi:hypothetical protein